MFFNAFECSPETTFWPAVLLAMEQSFTFQSFKFFYSEHSILSELLKCFQKIKISISNISLICHFIFPLLRSKIQQSLKVSRASFSVQTKCDFTYFYNLSRFHRDPTHKPVPNNSNHSFVDIHLKYAIPENIQVAGGIEESFCFDFKMSH